MRPISFVLVGPGALGLTLAGAWVAAGHHCVGVYGRKPSRVARARRLLSVSARHSAGRVSVEDFRLLLIAVPDGSLAEVAQSWAPRVSWKGKIALHTSGALPASLLAPLRQRGASIGCMHPLTSLPVPVKGPDAFRGISFGLEGDRIACALASKLAHQVGGQVVWLREGEKSLYHLSACLASGYLLALLALAAEALEKHVGLRRREARGALLALASSTLLNARRLGIEKALTGPLVRGDRITLHRHLHALRRKSVDLRRLHAILARKTLEMSTRSGRLGGRDIQYIRLLLDERTHVAQK